MSNFITKLLKRADEAMPQIEWTPDFPLDLDAEDLIPHQQKLAIESTLDTVSLRLRSLNATKANLESEIARMTEELRQANIAIDAMTAAATILSGTTPPAPALTVVA